MATFDQVTNLVQTMVVPLQGIIEGLRRDTMEKFETMNAQINTMQIHINNMKTHIDTKPSHPSDRLGSLQHLRHLIPEVWTGEKDDIPFVEFAYNIKALMNVVDPEAQEIMEAAERMTEEIDESFMEDASFDNAKTVNKVLGEVLVRTTKGTPKVTIRNVGFRNGLECWRRIVEWYDPRTSTDSAASLSRVMYPVRAKDTGDLYWAMQEWERAVKEHETKYNIIQAEVKMNAFKGLIPHSLLESHFRGKEFKDYKNLRRDVLNFINDKSGGAPQRHPEVSRHDHAPDVSQMGYASGKGRHEEAWPGEGGGSEVMYMKGEWKGGNGYDRGGDVMTMKGDYRKGGKGGEKGKGKAKWGGAESIGPQCWTCGVYGHPARLCPTASGKSKGKGKGFQAQVKGKGSSGYKGKGLASMDEYGWDDGEQHEHEHEENQEDNVLALITDEPVWECEGQHGSEREENFTDTALTAIENELKPIESNNDEHEWKVQVNKRSGPSQKGRSRCKSSTAVPNRRTSENRFHALTESEVMLSALWDTGPDVGEQLNKLDQEADGWTKITATVDSGAAANVLPEQMLPHIPLEESEGSRMGKHFMAAGGAKIPNLGQKVVKFITEEGHERKIAFQVAKVNKVLVSVAKITEAGNDVYMNSVNPHIKSRRTGEIIKMRKENSVFVCDFWVRVPAFHRRG